MSSDNHALALATGHSATAVPNATANTINATSTSTTTTTTTDGFYYAPSELLAGGAAGFVEHFATFPFDTIKTRIQSEHSVGISSAVRHMWCNERLTHLYRGFAPVIFSAVPSHGAHFGTYEAAKRVFGEDTNLGIMVSASCAVAAHDTISTPFDVIKQRMQMDGMRRFSSSLQCATNIISTEGTRALFVSLPTTIIMNVPHYAIYWMVYEGFLSYLGGDRRDRSSELAKDYVFAGLLAGAMASFVSSPFDVAKTQLQLGRETDLLSVFQNIMRRRGVRGFFAGVSARILATAPSGALTMFTYETVKKYLERY
ncbi:putative mitochondrial carrier protein [Trypanosoma theileri]|uniref:Putative mitochondrial carrier protein n=1 Tax=Trypanosoma theileri TaxID=67003 RepID=A0A1X0P952_9TRYP|nr:putative mitochondrial carrier protein [Trypanosoma theileri]ORC93408.1 putative mitochondrial carrier protein [Trypanosoma theileri]